MVGDRNDEALDRLDLEYNFAGYPSVFVDGGDRVSVGGTSSQSHYRSLITGAGARTVQPLNLIAAVEWYLGGATVHVRIGNGVPANTAPDLPAAPTGPASGTIDGTVEFQASGIDFDADDLSYQFDWGDGEFSEWLGPISSGDPISDYHDWIDLGGYEVKVRSKDIFGATSGWSPGSTFTLVCCAGGRGNTLLEPECDIANQTVDVADLTNMIDHLFINFTPLCCLNEADIAPIEALDGVVDVADLTALIDHLFINFPALPSCP